jgi:hypothetical protein
LRAGEFFGVISRRKSTLFINGTIPLPSCRVAPSRPLVRSERVHLYFVNYCLLFVRSVMMRFVVGSNNRSITLTDLKQIMSLGSFYDIQTAYKKSPHGTYIPEYKLSLPQNCPPPHERVSTLRDLALKPVLPPLPSLPVINQFLTSRSV